MDTKLCRREWTTPAKTPCLQGMPIWHACAKPAGHAGPCGCASHYDKTPCEGPPVLVP